MSRKSPTRKWTACAKGFASCLRLRRSTSGGAEKLVCVLSGCLREERSPGCRHIAHTLREKALHRRPRASCSCFLSPVRLRPPRCLSSYGSRRYSLALLPGLSRARKDSRGASSYRSRGRGSGRGGDERGGRGARMSGVGYGKAMGGIEMEDGDRGGGAACCHKGHGTCVGVLGWQLGGLPASRTHSHAAPANMHRSPSLPLYTLLPPPSSSPVLPPPRPQSGCRDGVECATRGGNRWWQHGLRHHHGASRQVRAVTCSGPGSLH